MGKLTFFSTGATPTATTIASQQVLKVLVEETYCREKPEWPERPLAWWQGGREPPPASLELSTPESNQSGDQILEIGDDEWMSVVDEQDIIHELEELEAEVNTEDETDYSDLESIWSVEPDSEIDEIEIEE
ncbi:uncharacterized protein K441DRAFT_682040 [Cenococcum geophilum 1.58]|uniref:Uncharacterized protein n=1 Tax=Cenococcum geophilum 1.58 TaxID=794803 RepID=A0ACC8EPW7_9PEZI|nr:hypothetical protein K441DRAFT_682040 [Cenococcum geophilum 1.58]